MDLGRQLTYIVYCLVKNDKNSQMLKMMQT